MAACKVSHSHTYEKMQTDASWSWCAVGPSWDDNLLAHEKWCNDLAVKFLCIFVLDRFGDFVSDQVRLPLLCQLSKST